MAESGGHHPPLGAQLWDASSAAGAGAGAGAAGAGAGAGDRAGAGGGAVRGDPAHLEVPLVQRKASLGFLQAALEEANDTKNLSCRDYLICYWHTQW
eukprot:CAMPEP_0113940524 /NCGR_PEP_ID=MMETSP1339-20121228/6640_1 /TAXON_ID=94617 /ORGANISM="Fibrocapsa japonica" /LENGTH=96 /DNA_ID=CAMNT_0000944383 /DNA_START=712 /DNA_END=1000 /DNA_ORIENTATION=- /assembly_acc=CAM_ASM_000762